MTFSHLSGNLWIPSQKNCAGLAAENESSQFLIPCSDVNILSTVFQIVLNRNSNMGPSVVIMENYFLVFGRIFRVFFGYCSLQTDKLCLVAFSIDGFTWF